MLVASCRFGISYIVSGGMQEGWTFGSEGRGGADVGVWSCRSDVGDVSFWVGGELESYNGISRPPIFELRFPMKMDGRLENLGSSY